MRQPRFRKRLEKEHIAEQILTKQIISLPSPWMATSVPLLDWREEREREEWIFFFFFFFSLFACIRILPMCQDIADLSRFGRYLQIESTYLRRHKCSGKRPRDR